jgi:hypothetical protein
MNFDTMYMKYFVKSFDEIDKDKLKNYIIEVIFHEDFGKFVQFFDMNVTDIDEQLLTCLSKSV